MRRVAIIGVVLVACTAVLYFYFFAVRSFGRPMVYEFPAGFKGWVSVKFGDSTCPPLGRRGKWLVVNVPSSGKVCTSTPHDDRWIHYRFEYVRPDGTLEDLPLRSGSDPPGQVQVRMIAYIPEHNWEELFVGSKEDAEANWGKPPDPWNDAH